MICLREVSDESCCHLVLEKSIQSLPKSGDGVGLVLKWSVIAALEALRA